MPEYSQVQTYVKLNKYNLKSVVMDVIELFHDLDVDIEPIKGDLCNLSWEAYNEGTAPRNFSCESSIDVANQILYLKPYIMIWSPNEYKKLNDPWVEISCLFRTQEIMSDGICGKLQWQYEEVIWQILLSFSKKFAEVGTYLTSEVTDGRPWEVLLGDGSDYWCFDAAIILEDYGYLYMNIPINYSQYRVDDKIYIIQTNAWNEFPW